MIPISRDFRLKKEFDGITYMFLPPVGDVEIELVTSVKETIPDKATLSKAYKEAEDVLEKEYKGMKHPTKKKWERLVTEKMHEYLPQDNEKDKICNIRDCINLVLVGWEGNGVPEFPESKPASMLTLDLMGRMYEWYWEQYPLKLDELKN